MQQHGKSISRSCNICGLSQSTYYYKPKKADDSAVKKELLKLAEKHPKRGFKKMFNLLRNNGFRWNHKRVYRVYCDLRLNLRVKPKKRLPSRESRCLIQPLQPNICWSIDFMSDALTRGCRFRTFNVIDDYNRECLKIKVAISIPATRVAACLDSIALTRGYPFEIRIDNGPEFISNTFKSWAKEHKVNLHFIEPGKPAQNGFIERFNRTYREEILDLYLFDSIKEVQAITDDWVKYYNGCWPHESLNNRSPKDFAATRGKTIASMQSRVASNRAA
jgi:putative transposase